jgi:heme/copper-type cytochrome/quinol oxidase subunit 3
MEFNISEITIADSVLGNIFYMTTGLHAIHVIIGVLF